MGRVAQIITPILGGIAGSGVRVSLHHHCFKKEGIETSVGPVAKIITPIRGGIGGSGVRVPLHLYYESKRKRDLAPTGEPPRYHTIYDLIRYHMYHTRS